MKNLGTFLQLALCLFSGACFAQTIEPDQSEIVLGMSTSLSGSAANVGIKVQKGVLIGLERANRNGGINGKKLRLIALDDGYEPSRTAPNMRKLIQEDNVLAVIGNVGTPTAIAAVPIADEQKTLFFAPFTGAGFLRRNPPDRYVINFRASYAEETAAMIDALIDKADLKPEEIAFFTQRDAYGDAGFSAGLAALKRHGLNSEQGIVNVRYERNTVAVENAVADLLAAEPAPRAVVMVGTYLPCAKLIKLSREASLHVLFLGVSFVGSQGLAEALDGADAPVIITQVVPPPSDDSIPMVREYEADLRAHDPTASGGFSEFEGYIASRILTLALSTIKGSPTRETVIDALEHLGQFDIGLGESLNLNLNEHQASHRIWPTVLRNGKFVTFQWSEITTFFGKEGQR